MSRVVDEINTDVRLRTQIENVVYQLCNNPNVINYRLDIITDLLNCPSLQADFKSLLPHIRRLARYLEPRNSKGLHPFQAIAWRLETLNVYLETVQNLHLALARVTDSLASEGLQQLFVGLDALTNSDAFHSLAAELPNLKAAVNSVSSVAIGINLNADMRPCEAVLLSVGPQPYQQKPFLTRLLGLVSEDDTLKGMGPFHSIFKTKPPISALEGIMFRDLNEILSTVLRQVNKVISRYTRDECRFLLALEPAIDFYLGSVKLIRKLKNAGFSMCRPTIEPFGARKAILVDAYDMNLALKMIDTGRGSTDVVKNSISFDDDGRIYILTGPNKGGKTTFARSIGTVQALMQVGLYTPGTSATISPVDGIYTHFIEKEGVNTKEGRLGEEARRLAEIFHHATQFSLILLNESLSSTSPGESLYLTKDIVKVMRYLGVRAVFATHLHDLAACADEINGRMPGGSRIVSIVSGMADDGMTSLPVKRRRTYKIILGPPQGESFARDIAEENGISLDKLLQIVKKNSGMSD